ncbi:rCG41194 [Rattus norvegicus]|uniref:RCG41194 n=1 Tax=Rattus norvegicus TaxID=10116 RepID=A6KMX5_RAT|nr:rCG41194 [Rattus norvegicus]
MGHPMAAPLTFSVGFCHH